MLSVRIPQFSVKIYQIDDIQKLLAQMIKRAKFCRKMFALISSWQFHILELRLQKINYVFWNNNKLCLKNNFLTPFRFSHIMQKCQLRLSSLSMYTLNSWLCAFYMHIIRTTNEVIIMWLQIIVNKGLFDIVLWSV